jgi:hypothetical protein
MRSLLLVLAVACAACFGSRPPTTVLQVIGSAPAGAVLVGPWLPVWIDSSDTCASPPQAIVMQAERWGADWIVPVEHTTHSDGRTVCRARGYAGPS